MKIAVWHNLPSGGGKRALYDHVRGLVGRGHEIEAWCPPTADRSYLPLSDLVTEHVVPLKPERDWNADPASLGILERLRWSPLAKLGAMEWHSRECAQQINALKFDLLFAASCLWFQTPMIGRFVDIPRILYLQEPNRAAYEAQPELLWPALSWTPKELFELGFWERALRHRRRLHIIRVLAREERKNALAFDQILVNSFYSRESVLRAFGLDAKVCYLGVDTNRFVNQRKERESFVVSVGALVPQKNIGFLVRSVAEVPARFRPKLLLIANTVLPSYSESIQRLADQLEVTFELKHGISDAEIVDILNRARAMVYSSRLEPFGFAPLEANACGLPVIAVAEGGVRETVKDGVNGILVEHEPESMAAAIQRLQCDDELHGRLSAQAENLARTFWDLHPSIDRLEQRLRARVQAVNPQAHPNGLQDDYVLAPR